MGIRRYSNRLVSIYYISITTPKAPGSDRVPRTKFQSTHVKKKLSFAKKNSSQIFFFSIFFFFFFPFSIYSGVPELLNFTIFEANVLDRRKKIKSYIYIYTHIYNNSCFPAHRFCPVMMQMYPDYHHHHHPQAQYPHHPQLTDTTSMNGFSRGSSTSFSYGHQEYRYFVDRGGGGELGTSSSSSSSRLCPTSLVDNNNALDAAGIGFAGNNDASSGSNPFVIPEDISVYSTSSNQWNWTQPDPPPPILAPAPLYPPFSLKSPPPPLVCSPTAQLPTPAAMAVLLNPNAQHTDFDEIPQGSAAAIHTTTTITARPNVIRPVEPVVLAVQSVPDSPSREKKHACTMCHKRQVAIFLLIKKLIIYLNIKQIDLTVLVL